MIKKMNEGIVLGDIPEAVATEYKPALDGIGEEKVVGVYNPLPHDFRVNFARQQAYRQLPDPNRQFARERGLGNMDKPNPRDYTTQTLVLSAGKIKNLPGDIAQIAVRKLVNTIIQTRNNDGSYDFESGGQNKAFVPDPELRRTTEAEVIKYIKDATEFFNQPIQPPTPQERTNQQIEAMNNEQAIQDSSPNPAPGTGTTYTPYTPEPATADLPQQSAPKKPGRPPKKQ